jgi:hypothetical protein
MWVIEKMFKIINFPIFLLFFLIYSSVSFASNRIGVVGAINSTVTAKDNAGVSRKLKLGDDIYYNDTIIANEDANAQLLFIDKSSLTIGSNSSVKIDNFIYSPSSPGTFVMRGIKGTFRFVGGALSKEKAVEFKTPVGIIGIRGGIAIVDIDKMTGSSSGIFIYGEELTFTNLSGITQSINEQGLTVHVSTPSSLPEVLAYTPNVFNSLIKNLSGAIGTSAGAIKIPTAKDIEKGLRTDSNKINNSKYNPDNKTDNNKGKQTKNIAQPTEAPGKRTSKLDSKGNLIKTYSDTSGNLYSSTTNTDGSSSESFIGTDGLTYDGNTDTSGLSDGTTTYSDGTQYSFSDMQIINDINAFIEQNLNTEIFNQTNVADSDSSPTDTQEPDTSDETDETPPLNAASFGCSDCRYAHWGIWANVLNIYNDPNPIENLNLQPYTDGSILENIDIPFEGEANYTGNVYGSVAEAGEFSNYNGILTATIILNGSESYIAAGDLGISNFGNYNMQNTDRIEFGSTNGFAIFNNSPLQVNGNDIGGISGALFNNGAENFGGNFHFNDGKGVSGKGIYVGDKE